MEGLVTLGDQIAEFHCIIKCVLCLIKLHCADFFPPCHFLLCISVYCVVFLLIYLVCVKVMVVVATHWLLWIYCVSYALGTNILQGTLTQSHLLLMSLNIIRGVHVCAYYTEYT